MEEKGGRKENRTPIIFWNMERKNRTPIIFWNVERSERKKGHPNKKRTKTKKGHPPFLVEKFMGVLLFVFEYRHYQSYVGRA